MATSLTVVPTPRFPSPRVPPPRSRALGAVVAVPPLFCARGVGLGSLTCGEGPLGNASVVPAPPSRALS